MKTLVLAVPIVGTVEAVERPKVEWREPDSEPASVTNVGTTELRALRIELKFLAR